MASESIVIEVCCFFVGVDGNKDMDRTLRNS